MASRRADERRTRPGRAVGRLSPRWLPVAAGAFVVLLPAVHAKEPDRPRPDTELLEFLGSDDQDPELQDYLARGGAAQVEDTKEARKASQERSERT